MPTRGQNPNSSNPPATFNKIVSTYRARFGQNDDQTTVTEQQRKTRQQTAAEGTDQYYDFATEAYLNGWGEHFHYCPFAPGESILQAMVFYEHRFAHLMGLKPGMKVLDVGCGVGGPAREIAKFIGCEIVGITINQRQVDRAIELTAIAGLSGKCTFIKGDFLNLPFAPSTFDAAYAIEATVHAPSLPHVYAGIARVLKPDAVFGLSEWVLTDKYNPEDVSHVGIRNRVERGNAISNLQTSVACRDAMVSAGFDIYHDEDYAEHWDFLNDKDGREKSSIQRPWYWPLAGQTEYVVTWTDYWISWRMSRFARWVCYWVIFVLEHLRLYPRGTLSAMTTMAYCVDSVVEGGKEGIFTPCWWFIGRKVREANLEDITSNGGLDRGVF